MEFNEPTQQIKENNNDKSENVDEDDEATPTTVVTSKTIDSGSVMSSNDFRDAPTVLKRVDIDDEEHRETFKDEN